jgi:hypothetical protein
MCVASLLPPLTETETSSQAVWRSSLTARTDLCDSRVSRAVTHSQLPGRGELRTRTPCNNCGFHSLLRTETELLSSSPQQLAEDELGSTCGCVRWRACLTITRGGSSASSSVRCTNSVAALVCLGSTFASRGHSSFTPVFVFPIHSKTHGCLD